VFFVAPLDLGGKREGERPFETLDHIPKKILWGRGGGGEIRKTITPSLFSSNHACRGGSSIREGRRGGTFQRVKKYSIYSQLLANPTGREGGKGEDEADILFLIVSP